MVVRPRPNPETVAALLDTTWRVAEAERARTESLDRKASTLATFAALVLSLSAGLGAGLDERWALALYVTGLVALLASASLAVHVLWPKEELGLGMAYLEGFATWAEIRKTPEQVRGETIYGLVGALAFERDRNQAKGRDIRIAFALLLAGLVFVVLQASILAAGELA